MSLLLGAACGGGGGGDTPPVQTTPGSALVWGSGKWGSGQWSSTTVPAHQAADRSSSSTDLPADLVKALPR